MKSGAIADSDNIGSEAGTMVIQTPFIIAPTHQASASTKKASASASGDQVSASAREGPLPLVLAGPSGAGKSTLIKRLMAQFSSSFGFSVSHTTRAPREGEEDGVAYNFVSQQLWILGESHHAGSKRGGGGWCGP